jgi:hypothetical protein
LQAPVVLTDTPAAAAKQALLNVLPLHPQTGA